MNKKVKVIDEKGYHLEISFRDNMLREFLRNKNTIMLTGKGYNTYAIYIPVKNTDYAELVGDELTEEEYIDLMRLKRLRTELEIYRDNKLKG